MHTLLWRKRALAIQRSCLSPTEKFSPFSMTSLSSLPGSALIFSFIFVRSMASQITSSSYIWKGSKLYLKIQKSLWRLQRKIIFIWNCDSHLTARGSQLFSRVYENSIFFQIFFIFKIYFLVFPIPLMGYFSLKIWGCTRIFLSWLPLASRCQ